MSKYQIQTKQPYGWVAFDEANDKGTLDLRFKWINHYYENDKFRKVEVTEQGEYKKVD